MKRQEIKAKFDEIVAFAVAAHLEPEILIVDEVLAVGHVQIQKKCQGKIEEVGNEGRTILFVSHNMAMISNLCQKGIVLEDGDVSFKGNISQAILNYYQGSNEIKDTLRMLMQSETVAFIGAEIIRCKGNNDITIRDELTLRMKYKIKQAVSGQCVPNFPFFSPDGIYSFVSNAKKNNAMPIGIYWVDSKVSSNILNEGVYFVGLSITTYSEAGSCEVWFFNRNFLTFNVTDPMEEYSNGYGYSGSVPGLVRPNLYWQISKVG